VLLDGKSILEQEPMSARAPGIFLAFQYPSEIPGVSIANFLRAAVQARMGEGEETRRHGVLQAALFRRWIF
jgi:Fe-S cluster assembly ATP-binding protein